jgi:hypothetical protein
MLRVVMEVVSICRKVGGDLAASLEGLELVFKGRNLSVKLLGSLVSRVSLLPNPCDFNIIFSLCLLHCCFHLSLKLHLLHFSLLFHNLQLLSSLVEGGLVEISLFLHFHKGLVNLIKVDLHLLLEPDVLSGLLL